MPCTTIPSTSRGGPERPAPLAPRDGGYLIVGVDEREAESAAEILQALERWQPGEIIKLRVRRNPYLSTETVFWQVDLQLLLP